MPYVAKNYTGAPDAPKDKWVCNRQSTRQPFEKLPPKDTWDSPEYCGQCVSFVVRVCTTLPQRVSAWKKGDQVKDNKAIAEGTVIATFTPTGNYKGHVAVFVSMNALGIKVWDQYVYGSRPKAIGPRVIRWNGTGVNNGNTYYVVE